MKKTIFLILSAVIILSVIVGCRNKIGNDQATSTTTVPTSPPTTDAIPEASVFPDPTVASGNGPIDETQQNTKNQTASKGATENGSKSSVSKPNTADSGNTRSGTIDSTSKYGNAESNSTRNNTR